MPRAAAGEGGGNIRAESRKEQHQSAYCACARVVLCCVVCFSVLAGDRDKSVICGVGR